MKLHRFDVLSFVTGIVITVIGLAFLLPARFTDLSYYVSHLGLWLIPGLLLVLGAAVLISAIVQSRRSEDQES